MICFHNGPGPVALGKKEVIPLKPSRRSIKVAGKGRNPTIVEPQLLQQYSAHIGDPSSLPYSHQKCGALACDITVHTVP